jgi:two-component system cell cycle response regulator DivK
MQTGAQYVKIGVERARKERRVPSAVPDHMAKRILVVEDNPDNRILITDILSALNYEVVVATDGESGVALARSERPDLILMDLSLPKMDGWTAATQIKQDESLGHIPVIALTAHAMVGDREKALQAGCDDYVSKPIDLRELASKLAFFLD